jgi:CBS domain-containing protein
MIVKNILAAKQGDVVTIEPTANLAAAVKLLIERHIGAVVSHDDVVPSRLMP